MGFGQFTLSVVRGIETVGTDLKSLSAYSLSSLFFNLKWVPKFEGHFRD